nr:MAG TPA: hypothetical protein [Caudoviricetes sp.]
MNICEQSIHVIDFNLHMTYTIIRRITLCLN